MKASAVQRGGGILPLHQKISDGQRQPCAINFLDPSSLLHRVPLNLEPIPGCTDVIVDGILTCFVVNNRNMGVTEFARMLKKQLPKDASHPIFVRLISGPIAAGHPRSTGPNALIQDLADELGPNAQVIGPNGPLLIDAEGNVFSNQSTVDAAGTEYLDYRDREPYWSKWVLAKSGESTTTEFGTIPAPPGGARWPHENETMLCGEIKRPAKPAVSAGARTYDDWGS